MAGAPHHEVSSLNDFIFMCDQTFNFHTQAKKYDISKPFHDAPKETSSSHPGVPLHIERPYFDTLIYPPKRFLQQMIDNRNTQVAHNYSIVEDLGQTPYSMSALEVLQSCPTQRKSLFSAIGGLIPLI